MISVHLSGENMLTGFTPAEARKIKEDLTFDNPKYKSAKSFSRFNHTGIDPSIYFYKEYLGSLIVPRGYVVPFPHKIKETSLIENKVLFPKFKWKLRDTQQEAFNEWNKSRRSGLIILQTGKGKTILGLYLASVSQQKTLVIVQKNDLIVGWTKDIKDTLGISKENVGLIKAGSRKIGRAITLSTIQTINNLSTDELVNLTKEFGMIIVDECHHSPADSYRVLSRARAKYLIGLTATDNRGDGLAKVMPLQFGGIVYRGKEQGNLDADILPVTVTIRNSKIAYSGEVRYSCGGKLIGEREAQILHDAGKYVKRIGIDANVRDTILATNADFNMQIVNDVLAEAKNGKSCLVLAKRMAQVDLIHKLIDNSKFPMDRVGKFIGGSKDEEFIAKAESKKILITIATVKKATEGTNVKAWERLFLASSLKQSHEVIQAVGRVRRYLPNKDVLVYDYRHPNVEGLLSHDKGRDSAYKKLKAKIIRHQGKKQDGYKFSRGFL